MSTNGIANGNAQPREIAVIGGGIIGASTAYYLTRPPIPSGLRVTLIEEAPNVAPAASGKSGGFLALDWHGPDTADLAKLSFQLHKELAEHGNGAKRWSYRNVDTLSLGFDESKSSSGSKSKCPSAVQDWIAANHITTCSNMGGGGTTAQATPLPLVEYLVEEVKKSGVADVLTSTRADKLEVDGNGRVKSVLVSENGKQRSIPCQDVIVAAGPWTGSLLKSLLPMDFASPRWLRMATKIDGSRAHSIVVQAPKATSAHCLFTDMRYGSRKAGAPEVYCRGDGTVYACGGSDDVALPKNAMTVEYDKKQTDTLREQMEHLSPSHLSPSNGAKVTREQACYLPVGSAGPVIAGSSKQGLYVAAGHSCWGITLGPGTGKVVREMVYNEPLSANIASLQ